MTLIKNVSRTGTPYRNKRIIVTERGAIIEHDGTKIFVLDALVDELKEMDWQDVERNYCYDEIDDGDTWYYEEA